MLEIWKCINVVFGIFLLLKKNSKLETKIVIVLVYSLTKCVLLAMYDMVSMRLICHAGWSSLGLISQWLAYTNLIPHCLLEHKINEDMPNSVWSNDNPPYIFITLHITQYGKNIMEQGAWRTGFIIQLVLSFNRWFGISEIQMVSIVYRWIEKTRITNFSDLVAVN